MFKELKYLFFILFIILTIFLAVDYYFSDINKKKSYRAVQEINEMIISYSEKLILLNNDTDNVVKYVEKNSVNKKKNHSFWKLINSDD